MPATPAETLYDLAVRSLEQQEREVNSLRARTGTLAAAAVAATFLTREAFSGAHPTSLLAWSASSVSLGELATVLLTSVYLLWPHQLHFGADAASMTGVATRQGAPRRDRVTGLQVGLVEDLSAMRAGNEMVIDRLRTAFSWALVALVVVVLGSGSSVVLG